MISELNSAAQNGPRVTTVEMCKERRRLALRASRLADGKGEICSGANTGAGYAVTERFGA